MADFQSEYMNTTDGINDIISTQLSSVLTWSNVPGGLVKAVSSSSGYAWGIASPNSVWYCQLPCNGNWSNVDLTSMNIATVSDIAVDDSTVYVLGSTTSGNNVLLSGSTNNIGSWNVINVPFSAASIFSTHTYIWAQDSYGTKKMCPKPCSMSNWISSPDTSAMITSASDTSLYGKDAQGNAVKSDETLQSGWAPIDSFKGVKMSAVLGQADERTLYGIDQNSQLLKSDSTGVSPLDTQGYTPLNMSIDPSSNRMWMTTTSQGPKGNVFTRLENPDYTTVLNTVNPMDRKRDTIVADVEKSYNQQTDVMTVNKQVTDVVTYFKQMFNIDRDSGKKAKQQEGHLQEQIRETQQDLDQIQNLQPIIQKIVALLGVVAVIYLIGSFLGTLIHWIAFGVLAVGIYYIVKVSPS